MKEKLMSRKFWMAILSSIVSITIIFLNVGGTIGTIMGIIGLVASSISYMIAESNVDVVKKQESLQEMKLLIETLKKEVDK